MKHKIIRNLLGGLSFTSALFVFQACYGTPQDLGDDIFIEGNVISAEAKTPVPGIKVSVLNSNQFIKSDGNGYFSFYVDSASSIILRFEDTGNQQNGSFLPLDTMLTGNENHISLSIPLKEK